MAEWTCPKCGKTIKGNLVFPINCCINAGSGVCIHRSEPLGKASCGCGLVYECRLLGKLCGDSQPLEFANFGKVILTDETYQRCGGCAEFSSTNQRHT